MSHLLVQSRRHFLLIASVSALVLASSPTKAEDGRAYTEALVRQLDTLRSNRQDVIDLNLQTVRNIMAAAPLSRNSLAVSDNVNYNMVGMADRARGGLNLGYLGWIGGENGNPFMNSGNYSPGKLHEWGKAISYMTRPCGLPTGGVTPLFGCSTSSSYPSGHTAKGTGAMLLMSYLFPERYQPFINRAQEYGESRIVAGQHYPLDVMASRAMSYKAVADLLALQVNDPNSWLNTMANPTLVRQGQISLCGGQSIAQCASSRVDDFSVDSDEDYKKNKAYYAYTKSYNFPVIGPTDVAMQVPENAEYLILTRYPYLGKEQLREILRSTADPSGAVLDDPWNRINLFNAAEGYGKFAQDVTVTMDASLATDDSKPGAGFYAADRWRNDIGGPGQLTKAGTGVLTLAGDNSFAGFTLVDGGLIFTGNNTLSGASKVDGGLLTIDGGTLVTGNDLTLSKDAKLRLNDGTIGSRGRLNVVAPTELAGTGRVNVDAGAEGTISGSISGAGVLEKTGGGQLVLTGQNSYTGGTTVSGGTLSINGAVLGAALVADGGTLGGNGLIGAVTVNSGGLLAPGNSIGTLTVSGDVTFNSGSIYGVEVDAQGNSDRLAASAVTIQSGVEVMVDAAPGAYAISTTYKILTASAGVAGTFSSVSDNYAFLTAALSYDQSNVYLTLTRSSAQGDGVIDVVPSGPLIINSSDDVGPDDTLNFTDGTLTTTNSILVANSIVLNGDGGSYAPVANSTLTLSGPISGNGGLTKEGGGRLVLSGASTFTGSTTVSSGILAVNGSILSDVTVQSGGTLGGNGTIGGLTVGTGGKLAPGNSIGTLTVAGNAVFTPGSIYAVEVDSAGRSDRTNVSGTVRIDTGAVVSVTPENRTDDGRTYALSTRYAVVTAAGGVNGTFDSVTDSFSYLDSVLSYDPNTVYLTLNRSDILHFADVVSTPNQKAVANAVEALGSGNGVYEGVLYLPNGAPEFAFDQLSGEIHPATIAALADRSHFVRSTINDRLQQTLGGMDIGAAGSGASSARDGISYWMNGFGAWSDYGSDGSGNRLAANGAGTFFGAEASPSDNWRFGLAGGYGADNLSSPGTSASAAIDSYHLAAYGGTQQGPASLRFGGSYSLHAIETRRSVTFPGFSDTLKANYDASTAQIFVEGAWRFDTEMLSIEPFANIAYVHVNTDRFTEEGGAAALSSPGSDYGQLFTMTGVRFGRDFAVDGTKGKISAGIGWRHAYNNLAAGQDLNFAGGNTFEISSASLPRNGAVIDIGLQFALSEQADFSIRYNASFSESSNQQNVNAKLGVKF